MVLGGGGFSIMPETVMNFTRADAGIAGDGEEALKSLAHCLLKKDNLSSVPNLYYWKDKNLEHNKRIDIDLDHFPLSKRSLFDNKKYESSGAMVGIETKRGCAQNCNFCADPVAKGKKIRLRPLLRVVREMKFLIDNSVTWYHLCDSEFNLPITHAKDLCRSIIQAGLENKIRWYCYCSPVPFDLELASLMKKAGCAGINFGVDSLCDEQLHRLGRVHRLSDVENLNNILRNYPF